MISVKNIKKVIQKVLKQNKENLLKKKKIGLSKKIRLQKKSNTLLWSIMTSFTKQQSAKSLVKKLYRTFISPQNLEGIILELTDLLISCIPMVLRKIFKTSLILVLLKITVFNENKTGTTSEL